MTAMIEWPGRLILDALDECLLGLDDSGRCVYASASLLNLLREERDSLLGRPVGEILRRNAVNKLPPWDQALQQARQSATGLASEHEIVLRPNGDNLPVEIGLSALADPAVRFLVKLRDLTESSRQSKAFHASLRSFRSLLDGVTDAIFFLARSGKGLDCNLGAQRMYGIEPVKFVGKSLLGLAENDSLATLPEVLEQVFSGQPQRIEFASKGRAGQGFPAEMYLYPANYFGQEAVLAMVHDIAGRKAYEAGLIRAKTQAEEVARMKNQFMGNMSHELRTPLNGIIGLGELLLETELDEEQRDYTQTVLDSGRHLHALLNDILDYASLSAGGKGPQQIEFSLTMLVEQLQARFGRACTQKGLTFRVELAEGLPELLLGDSQALSKVLVLLLDNAVKFTEQGEVVLRVDAETGQASRKRLRFGVRDTGIGIPADQHTRIFEAFSQVDGGITRKHGGTGMGLALAQAQSALLEGELSVQSTPGEGSEFTLSVPLQVVD